MPAGKFTIPNQVSYTPTISELLGAQLPEYEPGYTGQGYTGALEEPAFGPEDIALMLLPLLKGAKIPSKKLSELLSKPTSTFNLKESHIKPTLRQMTNTDYWGANKEMPGNLWEHLERLLDMRAGGGQKAWMNDIVDQALQKGKYPANKETQELLESILKSERGSLESLTSILKSERGSFSNKPIKTEGHHTLPIGGITPGKNLDAAIWQIENLPEGWKTIKDIPKELHKKATRKQAAERTAPKMISKEERDRILSKLITTPERAELLNDYRRHLLEAVLSDQPKGTKAHLFGSAISNKPNPKDLDVLLEYPTGRHWWDVSQNPEKLPVVPKIDFIPSPPLERVPSNLKKILKTGKEKYGPEYDLIRILSILGALPLTGLVESEKK
jgi:hypothetical protein